MKRGKFLTLYRTKVDGDRGSSDVLFAEKRKADMLTYDGDVEAVTFSAGALRALADVLDDDEPKIPGYDFDVKVKRTVKTLFMRAKDLMVVGEASFKVSEGVSFPDVCERVRTDYENYQMVGVVSGRWEHGPIAIIDGENRYFFDPEQR